jgi:hypothetical protein
MFRSSHVDARALRWKERKEALEAEVHGGTDAAPRKMRFRQGAGPGLPRLERVRSTQRARRRAMVRSVVILALLFYAAWRGLLWVETTDFAREHLMIPAP